MADIIIISRVCLSVYPQGGPHVTSSWACLDMFTWDPPSPSPDFWRPAPDLRGRKGSGWHSTEMPSCLP